MTSDQDFRGGEGAGRQPQSDPQDLTQAYGRLLARIERLETEVRHLSARQPTADDPPDVQPGPSFGSLPQAGRPDPFFAQEPSDDTMAPRPPRQEPTLGQHPSAPGGLGPPSPPPAGGGRIAAGRPDDDWDPAGHDQPGDGAPGDPRDEYGDDGYVDDGYGEDDPATAPPPPPRRKGRRVMAWLVVLALVGGGVWVAQADGEVGALRDRLVTELRTLAGLGGAPEVEAPPPAASIPEQTPAEQDEIAEGLEETFAAAEEIEVASDTADDAAEDETVAETADVEGEPLERPDRTLAPGQGPAVAAAPRGEVEVAALTAGDLAPLPADAPQEVRDIARLAQDGNAEAQHDLATLYAMGSAIPQNYERAVYWYGRSSDGGVANSLYNLGVLTERGLGTGQDSRRAFQYFLRAAEDDHPDAQFAVGLAYANGRGTEVDLLRAATWFQAASSAGNPRGAFHMGRLFEQGLDGAPDLAAAAGWYRIAAEAGDADATAALQRLTEDGIASDSAPAPVTPAAESVESAEAVDPPEATPVPVAPEPAPEDDRELTREETRDVQRLLNELGFDAGPADGLMGARTAAAIEQFERAQNAPPTGRATPSLLILLRAVAEEDNGG